MNNQEVYFQNIREKIIETLETANKEILIAVAWFTDEKIIKVLDELSTKGVKISIIFYDDKINKKELFKTLYYRKVELNVSKKMMHNKFCVIDREIVINGSYNWTFNASLNNENIQITKFNNQLVDSFVLQFDKLKESCSNLNTYFKYSINNIIQEIKNFENNFDRNIKGSVSFPYFYKIDNLQINPVHKNVKLKSEIIIIKNLIEEYNIFILLYFLQKDFPLVEISKVINLKFIIPKTFESLNDENFILNKFIPVTKDLNILKFNTYKRKLLVEEKEIFDAIIFNQLGEEIQIIQNCYQLPSGFYISPHKSQSGLYLVYDKYLNEILVDSQIVDYIDGFGFIVRKWLDGNYKRYSIYDISENKFIKEGLTNYFEYNLRSYLFSEVMEFAKETIDIGEVNFELSKKINTSYFYSLVDALIYYKIINDKKQILIKSYSELDLHLKNIDKKITFFELPCLEKKQHPEFKMYIIERCFVDFKINHLYKEIIYDINSKKLIYGKNNNNSIENYFFYSDNNFKYDFFYKELIEKKYTYLFLNFCQTINNINCGTLTKLDSKKDLEKYIDFYYKNFQNIINYNKYKKKEEEKSCYIATMVYKDINHPQVEILRNFRDNKLYKKKIGRIFVNYYYRFSPSIVKKLKNHKTIHYIIKFILDSFINIIKKNSTQQRF